MMHISFSSQRASTHRAFTLIELLVAVSIISLLSSLVLASVNKARDDAKTKTALQFAAQNDRIMGDEAIGIWNFEEGSGTTVRDASGWGNHGTISGATFTTDTYNAGVSKYALSFDGTDWVNTGVGDGRNMSTEPLTISMWGYPSISGSGVRYLAGSGIGSNQRFRFGVNTGFWDMIIQTGFTGSSDRKSVKYEEWTHVTLVADGSVASLYINGELSIKKNYAPYTLYQNIGIGKYAGSSDSPWYGLIDDVRIYARSLTAQEVKEQYLAGVEKLYANGAIDEEEYRTRLVAVE